jgi:hypothetical protein
MFSINQPLFLQKLRLYIQIPNIYLGLGFEFEFGLQRIWDLASCVPARNSPFQKTSKFPFNLVTLPNFEHPIGMATTEVMLR